MNRLLHICILLVKACIDRSFFYIIPFFTRFSNPERKKSGQNARSSHNSTVLTLRSAPKHFAHVHRRLLQHLVPDVRIDVRRGLVVRVAYDLHRDQRVQKATVVFSVACLFSRFARCIIWDYTPRLVTFLS